jgi:pilus assembly protein CpaB
METVNKKVILISILMAFITTCLIYIYIKQATTRPVISKNYSVYVATKTLPANHSITESDLMQVRVGEEYLNPKAVTNKSEILGKRLKDRIIEGEQILRDRLVDNNKMTLAYSVPAGKRAVSLNINEQLAVANMVRPGDFVDIIASFDKEDIEDNGAKIVYPRMTKMVLQNIQVLALGQDQVISDDKISEPPKTLTLAVDPKDTEKLVYASEFGVLRFALRPVGDNTIANIGGIGRKDLTTNK